MARKRAIRSKEEREFSSVSAKRLLGEGRRLLEQESLDAAFERFREAFVAVGEHPRQGVTEQEWSSQRRETVHLMVSTLAGLLRTNPDSARTKLTEDEVVKEIMLEANRYKREAERVKKERDATPDAPSGSADG